MFRLLVLQDAGLSSFSAAGDTSASPLAFPTALKSDYKLHPYYHIPKKNFLVFMPPFDGMTHLAYGLPVTTKFNSSLSKFRNIFLQANLQPEDVQPLRNIAYHLLRIASSWDPHGYDSKLYASDLLRPLSTRFLVVDTVWCICEALGPPMQKHVWWPLFMSKLPTVLPRELIPISEARAKRFHLVEQIFHAFEIYRSGRRPEPMEIIQIQREIFQYPCSHYDFREPRWDPWRADDKSFKEAHETD